MIFRPILMPLISAALLTSCGPSEQMKQARAEYREAQRTLDGTRRVCQDGPEGGPYAPPPLSEAERARAEWDIAAAESIPHVSTEQEWEIRASLGAEMGLAPSQVNGWKDIYRSRAEIARRKIEAARQPTEEEIQEWAAETQKSACANIPQREKEAKAALDALEQAKS